MIEVPEIQDHEYKGGFFNAIGIPRPIKSELKTMDGTQYRMGYFSDGLTLCETISEIDTLHSVEFAIHIDKSQLRDVPTDQHVLRSDYFTFDHITYELIELSPNKTVLQLSCDYTLNSKMNGYASFWADVIIDDFESRLLQALKGKVEKKVEGSGEQVTGSVESAGADLQSVPTTHHSLLTIH